LLAALANPAFESSVEPAPDEADGPRHVGRSSVHAILSLAESEADFVVVERVHVPMCGPSEPHRRGRRRSHGRRGPIDEVAVVAADGDLGALTSREPLAQRVKVALVTGKVKNRADAS